ncbi:DUF4232 domain-containing protein [Streptomyces sp. B93]|uniref:DUF4232 domain-containing protein n=1 Tax=Streptomyces sp. B93 TaxID=2824875 RepID=UPI001B38E80D|nr:DUF4232 domain-containing protein [Streptomyces sp. B93]MBQ1092769.1 DUF4232 domain-containing protein [Streptomyces sp. B93]
MRTASLTPPAALAGILLLTSCGTEATGTGADGPRPTGACATAEPGDTTGLELDGVRIDALGGSGYTGCAALRITNDEAEAYTYTVSLAVLSETGEMRSGLEERVASVPPGRTVRHTVDTGAPLITSQGRPLVRITKVRSVPADEAPAPGGPCPESGIRVTADEGDAAMGLRVVGLLLENCGTEPYHLDGYPRVDVVDEDHDVVTDVKVLEGGDSIAMSTGADGEPQPLDLAPGERARSALVWRNTTEFGTPVNAPYARVVAGPGADPVMVTPELDLGTTGKLGVGPWKRDES